MQYDLYDATAIAMQAINETLTVRQPQYTSTLLPPYGTFLASRQRVRTRSCQEYDHCNVLEMVNAAEISIEDFCSVYSSQCRLFYPRYCK
ncbi:uncharacterized protein LOC117603061 isoform X2 [Osmia lignaria lignaria]